MITLKHINILACLLALALSACSSHKVATSDAKVTESSETSLASILTSASTSLESLSLSIKIDSITIWMDDTAMPFPVPYHEIPRADFPSKDMADSVRYETLSSPPTSTLQGARTAHSQHRILLSGITLEANRAAKHESAYLARDSLQLQSSSETLDHSYLGTQKKMFSPNWLMIILYILMFLAIGTFIRKRFFK